MHMHVYDMKYENMVLSRAIEVFQRWQIAKEIHLAVTMLQKGRRLQNRSCTPEKNRSN